jgi:hypothetical protein
VVGEGSGELVEGGVRDVVYIATGEARDFHIAHFDVVPAEGFGGLDLGVEGIACFVADASECDHDLWGWGSAGAIRVCPYPCRWPF